jgi:tetratricopeptide (TPR) repeat protein
MLCSNFIYQKVFRSCLDQKIVEQIMESLGEYGWYMQELARLDKQEAWYDLNTTGSNCIEHFPECIEAYYYRGKAKYENNDYQEVMSDLAKVLEHQAKHKHALFYRGKLRGEMLYYQDAIQDFTSVIGIDADYKKAYLGRANVYLILKQTDLAMQDISQALALDDKYIEPHKMKATLSKTLGDYKKAIDAYTAIIGLELFNGEAYCERGKVYQLLGDMTNACKDWKYASDVCYYFEAHQLVDTYCKI